MTVPSFVTTRTGRLIGIIWLVGSRSERCSDPALRTAPMSLRSGADVRAGAADAMAARARALAVEDGAAASGIADLHRRRVEPRSCCGGRR